MVKAKKPLKNEKKSEKVKKNPVKKKVSCPSKPKKTKTKKVEYIKDHLDAIVDAVFEQSKEKDIYLAYMGDHCALIVKKKEATVKETINANAFQPFDKETHRVFFHTFILEWIKSSEKDKRFKKLVEMGVPVHYVRSPAGVKSVILEE